MDEDQLDTARAHIGLGALEGLVLADHDARDLVQQRRAAAHVARRERRVQRAAGVLFGLQAPGVLKRIHLGMQDGAAALDTTIVATTHNLAVEHQHRTNRDAALGQSQSRLGQCFA